MTVDTTNYNTIQSVTCATGYIAAVTTTATTYDLPTASIVGAVTAVIK